LNYYINRYKKSTNLENQTIKLPSSKSEANRLLVLSALSEKSFLINNLSKARDTQTLDILLKNQDILNQYDVLDAGTAMRFLTAYLSIKTTKPVILTGTDRMQQRPIAILADALKTIGADITYLKNKGYPPMKIKPLKEQILHKITIPGNVSSQYISALLMIAPTLPQGLIVHILPPVFSLPYIEMTISLMEKAGIKIDKSGLQYNISPQPYQYINHHVESDWSAASYWFSIIALAPVGSKINLNGLKQESYQGDQAIVGIMQNLGVKTLYNESGITIEKISHPLKNEFDLDFKECPDLAQTVLPCCASLLVNLNITGLESLRIKETDRILALQNELKKFNSYLIETDSAHWRLISKDFTAISGILINTYEDHRMAMGFAPLALKTDLTIHDIDVVKKSYPGFWTDLQSIGMDLIPQ
jgi:3-phosphoshikimate 1-carboxyvinyltransferase